MTSIFKMTKAGSPREVYIHTDDERIFDVTVRCNGKECEKPGFRSWFDAYDYGVKTATKM